MSCALVNGVRLAKLEESDLGFEAGSVFARHLVGTAHRPEWCRERATRGVLERLSGFEGGLFAHNPGAVDFFGFPGCVENQPISIDQFDTVFGFIGDGDRIKEEPLALLRRGVLFGVARANAHANALGHGFGSRMAGVMFTHTRLS